MSAYRVLVRHGLVGLFTLNPPKSASQALDTIAIAADH
jgi:hypothetical protein